MAITVTCAQCGTLVAAPDSAAGKKGRCTVCGTIVNLPALSAIAPVPAPVSDLDRPAIVDAVVSPPTPPDLPAPPRAIQPVSPPEPPVPPAPKPPISLPKPPARSALPVTPSPDSDAPRAFSVDPAVLKKLSAQPLPKSSLAERLAQPIPQVEPPKKSYCGVAALIALGIMSVTVAIIVVLFSVYLLPEFERKRTETSEAAILRIERAEDAYFAKTGEFAQRIAGPVNSLESAKMIAPDDAAAEAPPGPGKPLRGYLYRVLTQQGKSMPGGPKSFVNAQGKMTSGYALLIYPVEKGTHKKTYVRGPDGTVYSKDFGAKTAIEAALIVSFDVDKTWTPVTLPGGQGDRGKDF